MPTYDYICRTCGHRFEYVQSITSDALKHCPVGECIQEEKGEGVVERVVSGGVGLVFKGEGFYLTDYVRKSGGESKGGGSTKSGEGGSKESSNSSSNTKSGGESSSGSSGSK